MGRVDTPSGTFVLMAAGTGQSALDRLSDNDQDPNSVFTRQLIPLLKTPGLTHIDIAKRLQSGVRTLAATVGHTQQPAYYDEVPGTIVINPGPGAGAPPPRVDPTPTAVADPDAATRADFALAERANTPEVWQAFVDRYKSGFLVTLARQRLAALSTPVTPAAPAPSKPAPSKIEVAGLPPAARPDTGSCGAGAQTVSLTMRAAGVLTPSEERCLKPKDEFRECADCPAMVVIPAGSFTIGSPESEKGRGIDEGPQRTVRIGKAFAVGKFTVTVGEYSAFVDATGYDKGSNCYVRENEKLVLKSDTSWRTPGFSQTVNHPVVCVSMVSAQQYVAWVSELTGKNYRLLTEAEWEYAARGGTTMPFWWGSSITTNQANYNGNYTYGSGKIGEYRKGTVAVDSFSANPFGLYQMHGNVLQWVEDRYANSYTGLQSDGSAQKPLGSLAGVLRGGSWASNPRYLRAASRIGSIPFSSDNSIGFRVARSLDP